MQRQRRPMRLGACSMRRADGSTRCLISLAWSIISLGAAIKPQFTVERVGDVRHSLPDITTAQRVLGYKLLVDFEEGLRRTIS